MRLLVIVLALSLASSAAEARRIELVVFHINDVHGYIGTQSVGGKIQNGFPLLADALQKRMIQARGRGAKTMFAFAGDMFQGTPVVDASRGACMVDLFNALHLTVACLGNHEFDYGQTSLLAALVSARYPVVTTNVHTNRAYGRYVKDHAIIDLGPVKVGVVGFLTPQTPVVSLPWNVEGLEVGDPAKELPGALERLTKAGADIKIAVNHFGLEEDRNLARAIPGLDLIVSGHSHVTTPQPLKEGATPTWIVCAGDNTRFLGEISLFYDTETHRVVDARGGLIALTGERFVPNSRIARMVEDYTRPLAGDLGQVVGEITLDLPKGPPGNGSMICQLLLDAVKEASPTPIVLMNRGALRTGVSKGQVTRSDLHRLAPFGNTLVTMDLTGAQIREALETSFSGEWIPFTATEVDEHLRTGEPTRGLGLKPGRRKAGFLYAAGLSFRFDPRKPEGHRLLEAKVGDQPLDQARTYRVTMSNFLAVGGDNFAVFKKGKNVIYSQTRDRDALGAYLAKHSPIRTVSAPTMVNDSEHQR